MKKRPRTGTPRDPNVPHVNSKGEDMRRNFTLPWAEVPYRPGDEGPLPEWRDHGAMTPYALALLVWYTKRMNEAWVWPELRRIIRRALNIACPDQVVEWDKNRRNTDKMLDNIMQNAGCKRNEKIDRSKRVYIYDHGDKRYVTSAELPRRMPRGFGEVSLGFPDNALPPENM